MSKYLDILSLHEIEFPLIYKSGNSVYVSSDRITSLFVVQQMFLWYRRMKMTQWRRDRRRWGTEPSLYFPHPAAQKCSTARAKYIK